MDERLSAEAIEEYEAMGPGDPNTDKAMGKLKSIKGTPGDKITSLDVDHICTSNCKHDVGDVYSYEDRG